MAIRFHPHARARMRERGATENEVMAAVEQGESFVVQYGRTGFRRNFPFEGERRGRRYHNKQVEVLAVKENTDWLVLTVITRYF